ncbi:DNA methyltransferase [Candidatus Tokpelaia sp.]|uniref:DNA methyltransferase n=1 Tax=Candidatus Tokpelaia sp. TaxID=2233777 RepID=UPI001AED5802|nr:DNA methyltransferase [Candidatus Tokpelaia sp.]
MGRKKAPTQAKAVALFEKGIFCAGIIPPRGRKPEWITPLCEAGCSVWAVVNELRICANSKKGWQHKALAALDTGDMAEAERCAQKARIINEQELFTSCEMIWQSPELLRQFETDLSDLFKKFDMPFFDLTKEQKQERRIKRKLLLHRLIAATSGPRMFRRLRNAVLADDPLLAPLLSGKPIILDFFAGSGTTAQAVMELNAEDGGDRAWILCQSPDPLPENSEGRKAGYETVADIAVERIKRAGEKIITGKYRNGKPVKGWKPPVAGFSPGFQRFEVKKCAKI